MIKVGNKLVVFGVVTFSVALIYLGVSGNRNSVESQNQSVEEVVPTERVATNSQLNNTGSEITEEKDVIELPAKDLEEDSEEVLAKLWFDLRNAKTLDMSQVEEFKSSMLKHLKVGSTPQIVTSFPATIVNTSDFGFSVMQVESLTGYVNMVSAVLPEMKGRPRVINFLQNITDSGVSVSVVEGQDVLPSERGVTFTKDSTVIYYAGQRADSTLHTDDGSVLIFGIEVSGKDIKELDVLSLAISFPGEAKSIDNKFVELKSSKEAVVFSYNDVFESGNMDDNLYVVVEDRDMSTMYTVQYGNPTVFHKEKESERW